MAPLRTTLGRSLGRLLRTARTRDLAGTGTGGTADHEQLNSRLKGYTIPPPDTYIEATGGNTVTAEYPGGDGYDYKSHIFTGPGNFVVTAAGTGTAGARQVQYLVVGGGGGTGSRWHAGGGGAGGLLVSPNFPSSEIPTTQNRGSWDGEVSATTYPIVIGNGGPGASGPANTDPPEGGEASYIGPAPAKNVEAWGGGYGGTFDSPGTPGGSGGGGGGPYTPTGDPFEPGGAGQNYPGPTQQGFPGGNGPENESGEGEGGGGGGAGFEGRNVQPGSGEGHGGIGLQVLITAAPTSPQPAGAPGPGGGTGWFAGGGAGGVYNTGSGGVGGAWGPTGLIPGGPYAGGAPGKSAPGAAGTANTGGGGGAPNAESGTNGGTGGSGIVVIRYRTGTT